jgi:hypothetical protein
LTGRKSRVEMTKGLSRTGIDGSTSISVPPPAYLATVSDPSVFSNRPPTQPNILRTTVHHSNPVAMAPPKLALELLLMIADYIIDGDQDES